MLMDAQQRLVLDLSTQALAEDVQGTSVAPSLGVFVGISTTDYSKITMKHKTVLNPYAATGGALSVAAGRLSYFFGASGPSLSVDTACSSSL
eukprot:1344203-Pyramimonas_sp.AAC.1